MTSATTQLEEFAAEWTRCAQFLEPALADGCYSLGDVLYEIQEGRAKLWPMQRSAVVTRILQYPKARVLRIWVAGGALDELVGYLPAADNYARSVGCSRIEIEGRRGWAKALPGYETTKVVLAKEL